MVAAAAAEVRFARAVKGGFPSAPTPQAKLCGRTGPGAAHTVCCVGFLGGFFSAGLQQACRLLNPPGGGRWAREGVKLLGADTMAAIVWSWAEGGGGGHVLETV